ncbi:hypothetical protein XENOCAPTIV_028988, partial [Xenoophorus captivus]
ITVYPTRAPTPWCSPLHAPTLGATNRSSTAFIPEVALFSRTRICRTLAELYQSTRQPDGTDSDAFRGRRICNTPQS